MSRSNFGWNPQPTAGMIYCKTCHQQKPRDQFPASHLRISCHCFACLKPPKPESCKELAQLLVKAVDVPSLSYSKGIKDLMNGKEMK